MPSTYELGRYDAALCLGATFVFGGLVPTVERLRPAAPLLAVGEPYWREWPLPPAADGPQRTDEEEWLPLAQTVERVGVDRRPRRLAHRVLGGRLGPVRVAPLADARQLAGGEPGHPQAEEFRERGAAQRARYLAWERAAMGWAIFVCRS